MKEIINRGWYKELVDECKEIITEAVFTSRWALVEGYWNLGKRISEENDNFERAKIYGEKILQGLAESLDISERTIYYAVQTFKKYPDIQQIPEGKNISWNKLITQYLLERKEEKVLELPKQVNDPDQKEAVKLCRERQLNKGNDLIDVSENSQWFERGADLIENSPGGNITYNVRCDKRICNTGNVAVELIEISSFNDYFRKGYIYKKLDYIYYVDWINKKFYLFPKEKLKEITFSKGRYGFSIYHPKQKYFTLGVLVPLSELLTINEDV